jgi:hypothetical protein
MALNHSGGSRLAGEVSGSSVMACRFPGAAGKAQKARALRQLDDQKADRGWLLRLRYLIASPG